MDPATVRGRLERMLVELDSSSATLLGQEGDVGELSRLDQHPAEAATELTEQERDNALIAIVQSQRAQVEAALRRLDDGTYGQCAECGMQLPDERLDARPEAALCMSCQQDMETAR